MAGRGLAGVWWLVAGGVVYTAGVPWFVLDVAYTDYGIGSVFHLVRDPTDCGEDREEAGERGQTRRRRRERPDSEKTER